MKINNLKEKELLIANYFCDKTKKELTPYEVFDMWSNWFRKDFRVNGKPVFCIVNGELMYRKSVKKPDESIRREYNQTFQNIYKWIKRTVEINGHNKIYFKQELEKERNREYGRIIRFAKKHNIYLAMNTSYKKLAEFKLIEMQNRKRTITSGDCDKMIEYLEQLS